MPPTVAKGKPRPAAKPETTRPSEGALPPLRVRYYRRMKLQRVHTIEVAWEQSERPPRGEGKQVTLRLLTAGAQVLPSEQVFDATKPDAKALFYVTPLAKGWLRHVKLEVLHQGRKVQEIPMACKVVSQRMTWVLFFLTCVVPILLLALFKYTPLEEEGQAWNAQTEVDMAKTVDELLADNLPPAGFLEDAGLAGTLRSFRTDLSRHYVSVVKLSRAEPLAFYAGAGLLVLTLLSAWLHATRRKKAFGKPIPVVAALRAAEEDEDE